MGMRTPTGPGTWRCRPVDNVGYVVAGYVVTAAALAAYVAGLLLRARRARERAGSLTGRTRSGARPPAPTEPASSDAAPTKPASSGAAPTESPSSETSPPEASSPDASPPEAGSGRKRSRRT